MHVKTLHCMNKYEILVSNKGMKDQIHRHGNVIKTSTNHRTNTSK